MLDTSYYEKTDQIIAQYSCCLLYTSFLGDLRRAPGIMP